MSPPSRPAVSFFLLGAVILSTVIAQTVQDGALGPLMATALAGRGVEPSMIGIVVAAPWLTIASFSPIAARLFHVRGPAACMGVGGAISVACFLAFPIVPGTGSWLILSLALGFGMALRWIAGEAWLIALTPTHLQGRVIGLQETLIGFAGTAGPLILVATGTEGPAPFLACAAIMTVGAALPIWIGLQAGRLRRRADEKSDHSDSQQAVALAVLMAFSGGAAESGGHAFLPIVVDQAHFFGYSALFAASLLSLGGTLFQIPFGIVVDRLGNRQVLRAVDLALALSGVFLAFAIATSAAMPAVLLCGAAAGTFYTLSALIVAQELPPDAVPAAIARVATGSTLGSIAGPLAMGVAIDLLGASGLGATVAVIGLGTMAARRFLTGRR